MNYMKIKRTDVANGPGVRVSIFVSGCNIHCAGCFNKETWPFDAGDIFDDKAMNKLIEYLSPDYIEGLSILGGEPLDIHNIDEVWRIIDTVKKTYPDKSIWVYTGYSIDRVINDGLYLYPLGKIIMSVDVIVDGAFVQSERDLTLRFKGSRNQRIIDIPKSMKARDVVLWTP